jgi:HK97 family phage major capsid protein
MTREEREFRLKKAQYIETALNIVNRAQSENRDLTEAEMNDVSGLRLKAEKIGLQLSTITDLRAQGGVLSQSANPDYAGLFCGSVSASTDGPFPTFGEQLQAVQRAAFPGQQPDPRLFDVVKRAATGMSEGVPAEGGFLVQTDFSTRLLDRINTTAIVAPRCTSVPISSGSNGTKLPRLDESSRANGSRHGGVLGYWLAEAGSMTGTKPKFALTELTLHKVGALVYVTDELLSDAVALEAFVNRVAAAELAFQVDTAIIAGSGVGKPLGILNAPCTIEVAKEAGQAADTIVVENVLKMYSRLPASSTTTAAWFVSGSCFPQLYSMSIALGTSGTAVFVPPGGLSGKPYNTLLGLPVIPIEQCSKLGDKGDIILADMSRYLLATKGGVQAAASIHLQFLTDETAFRFIMRVDGEPEVPAPMTPYNGGDTESPFSVLAAR